MAAQLKVPTVFTAIDKVTAPVRKMQKSVKRFSNASVKNIQRVEGKFKSLIDSVNNNLGRFGVTLGAGLVILDAVQTIRDFEFANAKLAAVLGKTSAEVKPLTEQAKRLGATTSFSASQVSGLQTEYAKLGFTLKEIQDVAEPTLSLAAATTTELDQAAKQVGATIRMFGLRATDTQRVVDTFAASTSKSALNMEFLDVAFRQIGPVAKKAGFSLEDTTALLGTLADNGASAEIAGTAVRNIIFSLADGNSKLSKSLGGPVKNFEQLIVALKTLKARGVDLEKTFGIIDKSAVASFSTFLDGVDNVNKLKKSVIGSGGAAKEMADKMLNTLDGSIQILSSSYEGFILSLNDSKTPIGQTIRQYIDLASAVLTLAAGVDKSTLTLNEQGQATFRVAEKVIYLIESLKYLVAGYVTYKAIIILINAYNFIHATILGIQAARTGALTLATLAASKSLKGFKIGTAAVIAVQSGYAIATKIATGAQWALNVAMDANPIGAIIALIVILIAIIASVVKSYDEWGAAMTFALGPIGMIINLVMAFRRNWDMIKKAFKEEGIIGGLKAIGKTILDAVLYPLQQLFELLGEIPGIGTPFKGFAMGIQSLRKDLGVNMEASTGTDDAKELKALTSPQIVAATTPDTLKQRDEENKQDQRLNIQISEETENPLNFDFVGNIDVNVNNTLGAQ